MREPALFRFGPRRLLTGARDALASVFFPADCRTCEQPLVRAIRVPICDECIASYAAVAQPACRICGQPLPAFSPAETEETVCRFCQQTPFAFDHARSFGLYEGRLAGAILLLKFERMEPLGAWFA